MDSIRIKNLRSLKDTGEVELKPLTLLVGKNSSGKSTFLRTFPLFKQTIETKTNEPILWYSSRYVDFGSFQESINKITDKEGPEKKLISFDFKFNIPSAFVQVGTIELMSYRYFLYRRKMDKIGSDVRDITVKINIETNEKSLTRFTISIEDYLFEMTLKEKEKLSQVELKINGRSVLETVGLRAQYSKDYSQFLPHIFVEKDTSSDYFRDELFKIFYSLAYTSTKRSTITKFIDDIMFGNTDEFITGLKKQDTTANVLLENIKALDSNSETMKEIIINYLGMNINPIISICNNYLEQYFSSINYIAPIRASAERYYRIQGLSVDDIDPQGENIPMIFNNMTYIEKENYNKWLAENFDFQISDSPAGGHSSISIKYSNGEEVNLADTGFGYSQILPITLVLWQISKQEEKERLSFSGFYKADYNFFNLVIEQPELHLHPAIQAKLIDAFIKIIMLCREKNIDIKIIIETHSETMINRIGYIIAKNKDNFNEDLVKVIIFENDEVFDTKLTVSTYSDKGYLKKWPLGFFEPEEL
ncbi:AAA family ATPase [Planococcus sp. 4-30]|uniref:AAA family ATPase n=1 Tax=Planococcus sp. 4-30 TaxID=2874583 RepID=UPI001CC0FAA0|nr:AAA family ATPase [Planococcus sp. 4-30]